MHKAVYADTKRAPRRGDKESFYSRPTRTCARGLRASGRGKAKGRSFPAKLRPFTPLSERSCVYYSGTGPGGRQEKSRAALGRGISEGAQPNDELIVLPRRARAHTPMSGFFTGAGE